MGGNGWKFECFSSNSDWRFSVSFEDVLLMGTCSEILAALASFGKLLFSPSPLKSKFRGNPNKYTKIETNSDRKDKIPKNKYVL